MAVGDAHVFSDFLTTVLKQVCFQSQRLLFSGASAEVGGENSKKVRLNLVSNLQPQVRSLTCSLLSHPVGTMLINIRLYSMCTSSLISDLYCPHLTGFFFLKRWYISGNEEECSSPAFSHFPTMFSKDVFGTIIKP